MIRDQVQSEPESRTAAVSACFRDCLYNVSNKTVSDRNPNQKQQSIAQKKTGTKLPLRSPDPELSKSFPILVGYSYICLTLWIGPEKSSWWKVLNKQNTYKQKIAITTGICCLSRIDISNLACRHFLIQTPPVRKNTHPRFVRSPSSTTQVRTYLKG